MSQNTNKTQEVLNQASQVIDKAQSEAQSIQNQGFKSYFWSRKISMKLGAFAITVLSAFALGVIVGW
jgi:hypothetical protein